MFDLGPAADRMARLVAGVRDDQLGDRTPCQEWTVADLLAHVHQFATVFTQNARKEQVRPPQDLVPAWRVLIPGQLDELARAWHEESAWQGQVSAGGVEMAASDNAVVGIEELTIHGWDLARATGQPFQVDDQSLDVVDASSSCSPARALTVTDRSVRRRSLRTVRHGWNEPLHAPGVTRCGRRAR